MIKKIILIAIILIGSFRGFSQLTVTITQDPPGKPPVEGMGYWYTISYRNLPTSYNFVLTVNNGNAMSAGQGLPEHVYVIWNCFATTGTITVTETANLPNLPFSYTTPILSFLSSSEYCSIGNPAKQNLLLSQTPTALDVIFCSPNCVDPSFYKYKFQWQVGDIAIGTFPQEPATWTDIIGAENATYQPPTYSIECIKGYRRITSYDDGSIIFSKNSKTAVISTFDFLIPGTISWTNTFNNGIPVFTQTPATGGLCDGYNYVYTWEKSLDGINYTSIGTGISYPSTAQITGSCFVRRRVDCGGQTLYTNPAVQIIVQTLLGGTISGGGTYALNAIPLVTQTPASGGVCSTPDYVYTWERSVNNGPWVTFGSFGSNNPAYPAGAGVIATCRVRRKVHCVYTDAYSNIITFTMSTYTSINTENLNYVRVNNIVIPAVQSWEQADALPTGDKLQTTDYLDGFGRTMQTVVKQSSLKQSGTVIPDNVSNYQDLVSHVQYDGLGRTAKGFLPYATTTSLGFYKTNAASEQQSFINTKYGEPSGSIFTYSQITYDGSPINRVINKKLPGYYWNNDPNYKGISSDYDFFKVNTDNVVNWDFNYATGLPEVAAVAYTDNKLIKNITKDEKDKLIIEYKDLNGNLILKKIQEDNNALIGNYTGWINTYYVYDDFGSLRYTITPKAVAAMATSGWNIDSYTKKELCFYQEYDKKGRVIIKNSPGGGEVWLVYDKRDRLVLSQDENQRNRPTGKPSQWSYILYDDNNRELVTGLIDDNRNRFTMQNFVEGLPLQNEEVSVFTGTNWETIIVYNPVAGKKTTSGYYCQSCTESYTNSVKYYDEYPSAISKPYINLTANDFAITHNPYVELPTKSLRVKGEITGTKVRLLDGSYDDGQISNDKFLSSISYFDERGRIIQTHDENILIGTDVMSVQYDFSGKILCTKEKHNVTGNSFDGLFSVTAYHYDLIGRAKTLWKLYTKNIADISTDPDMNPSKYKKLAEQALDDFGRPKSKQVGEYPFNSGNPMEIQDFTYNIQGWLSGINKDYALADGNPGNGMSSQWARRFGMYLGYENGNNKFSASQWNGNITGVIWRSQGDNTPRKYNYEYDNVNRFKAARFLQKESPQANDNTFSTSKVDLSAFVNLYDPNGNIKTMQQKGITPGTMGGILIDDLTYVYQNLDKGNKLYSITDNAFTPGSPQNGTQGDFKNSGLPPVTPTGTYYDYDYNGNLKTDINKNIQATGGSGIVSNFLDLPQQITVSGKSKTEYTYDASGNKLAKKITLLSGGSPLPKTTYYVGNFIYEGETVQTAELQYILNEEGKLRIMDVTPISTPQGVVQAVNTGNVDFGLAPKFGVWDYYVKDNLSNTRMVLTSEEHMLVMNCSMENPPPQPLGIEEEENFGNTTNNEVANTRTTVTGPTFGWNSNNSLASKLQPAVGAGTAVGPNVILKVMAGDYLNAGVDHFYVANPSPLPQTNILTNIVQSLFGALTGSNLVSSGVKSGIDINYLQNNPSGAFPFLDNHPPITDPNDKRPRAYLNYIFFDEQFRYVSDCSSAKMVGGAGDGQPRLLATNIQATKNGYVYVFLSNETPNMPVYFDKFTVSHIRGPIVEDNAYYPYGLKMQGISAAAADKLKAKEGYQGDYSEHDDETGYNDFELRSYDPQIGRFVNVDPYDQFASPYLGMGNNPVNSIDQNGGWSLASWGALIGGIGGGTSGYLIAKNNGMSTMGSLAVALGAASIGAGIGYGAGGAIAGKGNFLSNTVAFYDGLLGTHWGELNRSGQVSLGLRVGCVPNMAQIPDIWSWLPNIGPLNIGWVDGEKFAWVVIDNKQLITQGAAAANPGIEVMDRTVKVNPSGDRYTPDDVRVHDEKDISLPPNSKTKTKLIIEEDPGDAPGGVFTRTFKKKKTGSGVKITIDHKAQSGAGYSYNADGSVASGGKNYVPTESKVRVITSERQKVSVKRLKIFGIKTFITKP